MVRVQQVSVFSCSARKKSYDSSSHFISNGIFRQLRMRGNFSRRCDGISFKEQ